MKAAEGPGKGPSVITPLFVPNSAPLLTEASRREDLLRELEESVEELGLNDIPAPGVAPTASAFLVDPGSPDPGEEGHKVWQPERISSRHKQIIMFSAMGMKNKDIARQLDMSESRVSVILNDPRSRAIEKQAAADFIGVITNDTAQQIKAHSGEALEMVVNLMRTSGNEKIQQTSAFDILDRAGFKASPAEVSEGTMDGLTEEVAARLLESLEMSRDEAAVPPPVESTSKVFSRSQELTTGRKG